jgi:hypothetical protein
MAELSLADQNLRGLLARSIARRGHSPSLAELALEAGAGVPQVEASLRRLHNAQALLLHPHRCEPWAVHPFALSPASCWVETRDRGYWANCLYCALGIAAALKSDARVTTRLGGEAETVRYHVLEGRLLDTGGVFHLSTPARHWWDNVIHACASFQPFASEEDVDPWCEQHAMPRGHVMSLEALWRFASDWYGSCLDKPWRKRTPEEVRALLDANGLTGDFWRW